jgi:hypothetical protein
MGSRRRGARCPALVINIRDIMAPPKTRMIAALPTRAVSFGQRPRADGRGPMPC